MYDNDSSHTCIKGDTSMTGKELVPVEYIDATDVTIVDEQSEDALVQVWLHKWCGQVDERGECVKPTHTYRAYKHEVDELRVYLAARGKALSTANVQDLQAYDTEKLKSKAPATRARAIAAIKSLYRKLYRSGLLTVNAGEFLDTPDIDQEQAARYLTPDQADDIIAHAKNERDRALLTLLYQTGMRVSEVVAVKWESILVTPMGAKIEVLGKRNKRRGIDIDQEMLDQLQALPHTASCVFPSNKTGECMTTTQAQRIVVDAADRAGIKASPHYLRHAHISHLLNEGVNVTEVRDEVGHSSIAVTNRYAHSVGGKALGAILRRK
jgi:integrase/recombinase XerD